jgi:hypothetical protein
MIMYFIFNAYTHTSTSLANKYTCLFVLHAAAYVMVLVATVRMLLVGLYVRTQRLRVKSAICSTTSASAHDDDDDDDEDYIFFHSPLPHPTLL